MPAPRPLLLLAVAHVLPLVAQSSVTFPGVEFNAAVGEPAHASSYFNYAPNALHDTNFVPGNANDGFPDETSWWSSGEDAAGERVFWQLNLSASVPQLARLVVRWHGFLTPAAYRVRVSTDGSFFKTVAAVTNRSVVYDRVDNVTEGLDTLTSRFFFLRLVMDETNVCADAFSCAAPSGSSAATSTNERVIYGLREVELWAKGYRNGAPGLHNAAATAAIRVSMLSTLVMATLRSG